MSQFNILPEILEALNDSNSWGSELGNQQSLVSLVDTPDSEVMMIHPLSDLSVRQQIVPLGIEIDRFGNSLPEGDRLFTITDIKIAGKEVENTTSINEYFAPGQFIELDESTKLSRPSFEKMQAGVQISADSILYGGIDDSTSMASADINYEEVVLSEEESDETTRNIRTAIFDITALQTYAFSSASGKAINQAKARQYHVATQTVIKSTEAYIIVDKDNLNHDSSILGKTAHSQTSLTAVLQAVKNHANLNPKRKGKFQVIKRPVVKEAL